MNTNRQKQTGETMMTAMQRTISARRRVGASGALLAATAVAALLAPAQAAAQQVIFSQDFSTLTTSTAANTVTINLGTALYLPQLTASSGSNAVAPDTYVKDFLAGNDVVTNNGYVLVGTESGIIVEENSLLGKNITRDLTRYEAEMRFVNLERFNNNGAIYLGSLYQTNTQFGGELGLVDTGTDQWHDDILSMEGTDFVAGAGSRIFMDANLNAFGQESCSAAIRITTPVAGDVGSGSLPANDCVNLAGGSATGRTLVNITAVWPGDRGVLNPAGNVIIDLTGGDAAQPDAFLLDPATLGYDAGSGVLDKGLFGYALGYDPDRNQFRLYGLAAAGSHQLPLLTQAAADLWRTASGGWFERQVDQRDVDSEAGRSGGFWARVASSTVDRGVTASSVAGFDTVGFDNSFEQEDDTVTFGLDLIMAEGAGSSWTLGGMIGYARSRVDFNRYDNTANLEGMHAGVYGGVTSGPFFVDAAVNGTWLDVDIDIPSLGLLPTGTQLATKAGSLGGQAEAGWRFGGERVAIEPLVGVTYVRTSFDDIAVQAADPGLQGALVDLDDATSLRANLGVRLTVDDFVPLTPRTRLSLTARHGQEFDGEAGATIVNPGPADAVVANTFDGAFSEISAAFTASNERETVGLYVRGSAVFGDGYDNVGASAGVRFQW